MAIETLTTFAMLSKARRRRRNAMNKLCFRHSVFRLMRAAFRPWVKYLHIRRQKNSYRSLAEAMFWKNVSLKALKAMQRYRMDSKETKRKKAVASEHRR
jgi:hypothetical protein